MKKVEPKVFLVANTVLDPAGMDAYLAHTGVAGWHTDAHSEAEELVEIMGRSCYRSFSTDLNPNLQSVREGNAPYMANILKVKHGSVLEHASVSFMFCNVSRVFTHELVRHRAGVAISQESLRFVRLTELDFWLPTLIRENEEAMTLFESAIYDMEVMQLRLTDVLITEDMPFSEKKLITSAMRRVAPMGLATNIGWTANLRTLRHVLDIRTAPSAEEEIRIVFGEVGRLMLERFPAAFGDFGVVEQGGLAHYVPENEKI